MFPWSRGANEKKNITRPRSLKVTNHFPKIKCPVNCALTILWFWTSLINKCSIFSLQSTSESGPLRSSWGYNSKTIGQIELILSQLKSGPKITRNRKMSKKWEMSVFSTCWNVEWPVPVALLICWRSSLHTVFKMWPNLSTVKFYYASSCSPVSIGLHRMLLVL